MLLSSLSKSFEHSSLQLKFANFGNSLQVTASTNLKELQAQVRRKYYNVFPPSNPNPVAAVSKVRIPSLTKIQGGRDSSLTKQAPTLT